jgi:hypothetical protein
MADEILFYISAASDLEAERAVLSRAVTEIPVTLGWRIVQSPLHGEPLDLQAVTQANVHLLLLGSDIRAPIGQEWWAARRANRHPVPFLKEDILRTPAAQSFQRYMESQVGWKTYKNISNLRIQILKLLGDHILEQALYYVLKPEEYQGLKEWREDLDKAESIPVDEQRGGTGASSVILSPERYAPSEGVLIKGKKKEK